MLSSGLEPLERGQMLDLSVAAAGSELLVGLSANFSAQQGLDEEPNAKHGLSSLVLMHDGVSTSVQKGTPEVEEHLECWQLVESPVGTMSELHVLAKQPAGILTGNKEASVRSMENQLLADDNYREESSALREAREALHGGFGHTSSLSKEMLCGNLMAFPVVPRWKSFLPRWCDNESADIVKRKVDNQDSPQVMNECLQKLSKRAPGMEASGTRTIRAGQIKRKQKGFLLEIKKCQTRDMHVSSGQTQNQTAKTLECKRLSACAEASATPEARQPKGELKCSHPSPCRNSVLDSDSSNQACRDNFPNSDEFLPSCCSTQVLILPMQQNPESALGVAAETSQTTSASGTTESSSADRILQKNCISYGLSGLLLLAKPKACKPCSKGESRLTRVSSSEPLCICDLQGGNNVKESSDSSGTQEVLHYKCCNLSFMPTSVPAEIRVNMIKESEQCTVMTFDVRLDDLAREQAEEKSSSLLKAENLNCIGLVNESNSAVGSLYLSGSQDSLCRCGKSKHFQRFRNNVLIRDFVNPPICRERDLSCHLHDQVLSVNTDKDAFSNTEKQISCPSEVRVAVLSGIIKFVECYSKEDSVSGPTSTTCEPEVQHSSFLLACHNQGNFSPNSNLTGFCNQLIKESPLGDTGMEVTHVDTGILSKGNHSVQLLNNLSSPLDTNAVSVDRIGPSSPALEHVKSETLERKDADCKQNVANPPGCPPFLECETPTGTEKNEIHNSLTLLLLLSAVESMSTPGDLSATEKYMPDNSIFAGCSTSDASTHLTNAENICRTVRLQGMSSPRAEQCERKEDYSDVGSLQYTFPQINSCTRQKTSADYRETGLNVRTCSKTVFNEHCRNQTNTYLSFRSNDLNTISFHSSLLESPNTTTKTAEGLVQQKEKQIFSPKRSGDCLTCNLSEQKLKEGSSHPCIQCVDQLKNVFMALKDSDLKTVDIAWETDCPSQNRPCYSAIQSLGVLVLDKTLHKTVGPNNVTEYDETDSECLKDVSCLNFRYEESITICTHNLNDPRYIMKNKHAHPRDVCVRTSLPEHWSASQFKIILGDSAQCHVMHSDDDISEKIVELEDGNASSNCKETLPEDGQNADKPKVGGLLIGKVCHVRPEHEPICSMQLDKSHPCESNGVKNCSEIELKVQSDVQEQDNPESESGSLVSGQNDIVDTEEFKEMSCFIYKTGRTSQCWGSAAELHQANLQDHYLVTCKRDFDLLAQETIQSNSLKQSLKCPNISKSFEQKTDSKDPVTSMGQELEAILPNETNMDITRGFVNGTSSEQNVALVLDHGPYDTIRTTQKYNRADETNERMADKSELLLHSMIYSNGSSPVSSKGLKLPEQRRENCVPFKVGGCKTLSLISSKVNSSANIIKDVNQSVKTVSIVLLLKGEEDKKLKVKELPSETACDSTRVILLGNDALPKSGEMRPLYSESIPCVHRSSTMKSSGKSSEHQLKTETHLFAEKVTDISDETLIHEKRAKTKVEGERTLFKRKRVHEDMEEDLVEAKLSKKFLTKHQEQKPCTEAVCFMQMTLCKAESIISASWNLVSPWTSVSKVKRLKKHLAKKIHWHDLAVCMNSSSNSILQEAKNVKVFRDEVNMPLVQIKTLSESLRLLVKWIKSFSCVPGTPTILPSSSFIELELDKIYVAFGNFHNKSRIITLKKQPCRKCKSIAGREPLRNIRKLMPSKNFVLRSPSQHTFMTKCKLQNFGTSAPKPPVPGVALFATGRLMDQVSNQRETHCTYRSSLILTKCTKESALLKELSMLASKLVGPTKSSHTVWPLEQALELLVLSEKCRQLVLMFLQMNMKVKEHWGEGWHSSLSKESTKKCCFHPTESTNLASNASQFVFDNSSVPVFLHIKMDSRSMLDLREVTSLPYAYDKLEPPSYPWQPSIGVLAFFLPQSSAVVASDVLRKDFHCRSGRQLNDNYPRPGEVKYATSEHGENSDLRNQFGLHTVLALSSPGCYRVWIRKRNLPSRTPNIQRLFMTQLKRSLKGLRTKTSQVAELFSSLPYSLGRVLLMWIQQGQSASASNYITAHFTHKTWQQDVSVEISHSHSLFPQVPWTLQHMEATGILEPSCSSRPLQHSGTTGILDLSHMSQPLQCVGTTEISWPPQQVGAMGTLGLSYFSKSVQNVDVGKESDLLCLPLKLSLPTMLMPLQNRKAVGTPDLPHLPFLPRDIESTATGDSLYRPRPVHSMKTTRIAGSSLQSIDTTRITSLPHVSLTFQGTRALAVSGLPLVLQPVLNVATKRILVWPHVPFHNTEATETSDCELSTLETLSLHSIPKTCLAPSWVVSTAEFELDPLHEYEVIPMGFAKAEENCSTEQEKTGQEKRPQRVSQIRIRKTVPKPDPNLTPMGLPRAKRLKKKEFSLEEIYTNKNYKSPPVARCLETIFEEPREKNGSLISISQQKRKRLLEFQDFTIPRKRKSRGKLKVLGGNTRGRKATVEGSKLDAILIQKLTDLEAFFAEADKQDGASGS